MGLTVVNFSSKRRRMEWEPSSSQKSDDVDEEFPYTSSQESQKSESLDEESPYTPSQGSGQSLDEEASYTASQSTSAYSDSEETIHVDSSLTRRLGATFSPKLTGKLVLFLARKRRAFIDRGKYGPVEMFLDKMFDCREFRHLSRQQLTIIHKFITRHKVMEEGGDDWTAAELERELRMEWESLRDDTCLWQSE
ncbi:hypothetical protein GSI_06556 [Ganoderma sinense ZZ0214-1]|uniref:Uncharacterized protein n=1 Tax=Ganoderma sinense ZZ0214-1 TaxID=1077348 RepID=A0A2G8SDL6_9APHY|nr:hypothetical protein GSI_06556 [Ganoderma sinense ZZ0214-1]